MPEKHLKRFIIVSHHVSKNCSYFEISLYPIQNGQDKKKITKTKLQHIQARMWREIEHLFTLVGVQTGVSSRQICVVQKLKMYLAQESFHSIHPTDSTLWCRYRSATFFVARKWKQFRYLWTDEWRSTWYIYTVECFLALKIWSSEICGQMDGTENNYPKPSSPDWEKQILQIISHMWRLLLSFTYVHFFWNNYRG